MSDTIRKLPDSELEVMQVIWSLPIPAPRTAIEEAMQQIHPIAQTTLLTLLTRLAGKNFISIEKRGRSSEYTALISKDEYLAAQSRSFLDQLCGGKLSVFAAALSGSGLSKEDLDELRAMLDEDRL